MCSLFVPQASTYLLALTGRSPARRCCCKPGRTVLFQEGLLLLKNYEGALLWPQR